MGQKLVVGAPLNRGLRRDREAFIIDNDSFPTILNAYQWRGRIKRKRGTSLLTRLNRFFDSTSLSYSSVSTIALNGFGIGNLVTGFSLQSNGSIVPGTVTITIGLNVYTDPTMDGYLTPTGTGGVNTINYATGVITIPGEAGNNASASFIYYPDLPVMGIEDLILNTNQFPGTLAFDTVYSYNVITDFPYLNYDVSFYKNPDTATYPGYVRKTDTTPTTWNGQDYQQFWTVNYQGALWATNGIEMPNGTSFDPTNVGMQFKAIQNVTISAVGPPAQAVLQINGHGLVEGDFIFVNEVSGITGINFQTGYVIAPAIDANNVNVEFPNATLGGAYISGGIAQYLTSRSDVTKDCIRWYDGDPTNGSPTAPVLNGTKGWVNFAPPLSEFAYTIADNEPQQYYLVGARMIVPFKDRLLFIGPVIQTSAAGSQVYLQDTVIYSQNGTPYYTCSYTNSPDPAVDTPTSATNVFTPILVPDNPTSTSQTATPSAYFEDQTGFGGFVEAGLDQPINTVSSNEDVLIMGFGGGTQARFIYTGNDIIPFTFYLIDSELDSSSTFSAINLGHGVVTKGNRGYILTTQTEANRIDLAIPDEVFRTRLLENGNERVCAQRDFINEWIYFTYPSNDNDLAKYRFPTQTLLYNYRDNSWSIFRETYTTYGTFRKQKGFTWATVGFVYQTWNSWNVAWNAGTSTLLQPDVVAGNQQGFILVRDDDTDEDPSLYIQSFSGNLVTSPDHCLNNNDFIIIKDCIGTISSQVNGKIFQVYDATQNNFKISPLISSGTYSGLGTITRLYRPFIQTKQFPLSWDLARKTRLGVQQYLLTKTAASQITLQIYLSQNASTPFNTGPIVPTTSSTNDSLIYSTVLYTCPESTNLGLTAPNTNLQMLTQLSSDGSSINGQSQIWHRVNTSLIGDTVQLGFTLSDEQMRSLNVVGEVAEITGATQASSCVLTCDGNFAPGTLLKIENVVGMTQLNFDIIDQNYYLVLSSTSTQVTIDVDSSAFDAYVSGGIATPLAPLNQTAEIELHGFVIDVTPSQVLA